MSESKLLENSESASAIVEDAPSSSVEEKKSEEETPSMTERQKKVFARVNKEVTEFRPPAGFVYCLPNLLRGISTKFEKASEDETLSAQSKTAELLEVERAAEQLIKQYQSEYAIFFSAKEVSMNGKTAESQNNWHPLHVPSMIGRAKLVLIHIDSWQMLENYSIVVRWHQSVMEPEESEVYEIYALPSQGAALSYIRDVACIACKSTPAPFKCLTCGANYCSNACKIRDSQSHTVPCLTTVMEQMQLAIGSQRMQINQNRKEFVAEQKIFEKRNRGKVVTVRTIDKNGNVITETQEVVVPAEESSNSSSF